MDNSAEFAATYGYSGDICPKMHCAETNQHGVCEVVSPFTGVAPHEELCQGRAVCPRDICPVGLCQQDVYTTDYCPGDMCEDDLRPHDGNQNQLCPIHVPDGEQYQGDTYPQEFCQHHGVSHGNMPAEGQYVGDMCPRDACHPDQGVHAQDLPACAYNNSGYPLPSLHFPMSLSQNAVDADDDYGMVNGQVSNLWFEQDKILKCWVNGLCISYSREGME